MKKYFISCLLILCLILGGCINKQGGQAQQTEQPKQPTAAEIFERDTAEFAQKADYILEVSGTSEKIVGTYAYKEELTHTLKATGAGTADATYGIDQRCILGTKVQTIRQTYANGKAVLKLEGDDNYYIQEMTEADWLNSVYPLIALDAKNYETVTYDEANKIFTFTDAKECEAWLTREGATVVSATGTADLGTADALKITYNVEYSRGPLMEKAEYKFTLGKLEGQVEAVNTDRLKDTYIVPDIRIPSMLAYAKEYADLLPVLSGQVSQEIACQLANVVYYRQ